MTTGHHRTTLSRVWPRALATHDPASVGTDTHLVPSIVFRLPSDAARPGSAPPRAVPASPPHSPHAPAPSPQAALPTSSQPQEFALAARHDGAGPMVASQPGSITATEFDEQSGSEPLPRRPAIRRRVLDEEGDNVVHPPAIASGAPAFGAMQTATLQTQNAVVSLTVPLPTETTCPEALSGATALPPGSADNCPMQSVHVPHSGSALGPAATSPPRVDEKSSERPMNPANGTRRKHSRHGGPPTTVPLQSQQPMSPNNAAEAVPQAQQHLTLPLPALSPHSPASSTLSSSPLSSPLALPRSQQPPPASPRARRSASADGLSRARLEPHEAAAPADVVPALNATTAPAAGIEITAPSMPVLPALATATNDAVQVLAPPEVPAVEAPRRAPGRRGRTTGTLLAEGATGRTPACGGEAAEPAQGAPPTLATAAPVALPPLAPATGVNEPEKVGDVPLLQVTFDVLDDPTARSAIVKKSLVECALPAHIFVRLLACPAGA